MQTAFPNISERVGGSQERQQLSHEVFGHVESQSGVRGAESFVEWVSTLELNDPGMSQVFISHKYHILVIYLLFVMTNDK